MRRHLVISFALLCASLLAGCDAATNGPGSTNPAWSSDPRDATDPTQTQMPLKTLPSTQQAEDALQLAGQRIVEYRGKGLKLMTDAVKQALAGKGIATAPVDKITDQHVGEPLPTALGPDGNATAPAPTTPPTGPLKYSTYFACPILAPEPTQDDDCNKLVAAPVKQTKETIEQGQGDVAKTLDAAHAELAPEVRGFVIAWSQEALRFGANVAAIYATQELRAAGACDTKLAAMKVSHVLGVEQGEQIVVALTPWALAQACVVNTDVIAQQVKQQALAKITTFMQEHKVCVGVDVTTINAVLLKAEEERKVGIIEGIGLQVEVLRKTLVAAQAGCRPAGDPLVLDLEGEGLTLAAAPVTFDLLADGHPLRVSWVGPRVALLALDRDGDGKITAGDELLSDRSPCGAGRCDDGVAALAAWDDAARGGNNDGLIDARDAVYARLRLWVDANQDGVSQPGELTTLAARGVLAISLRAHPVTEQRGTTTITSRLDVLTTRGFRTGYDLWFGMELGRANLAALRPAAR